VVAIELAVAVMAMAAVKASGTPKGLPTFGSSLLQQEQTPRLL
jgi:hypothetical protein